MKKTFARKLGAFVILMMCMLFAAAPAQTWAASNTYTTSKVTKTQKKKAYAAYKKLLSKSQIKVDKWYSVKSSDVYFNIGYINNDKMPDLFVFYGAGARNYANAMIYTYKNGKVKKIGTTGGDFLGYYKKTMVCQTTSRSDAYGNVGTYYEKANGKSNKGDLLKYTSLIKKGAEYKVGVGNYSYSKISKSSFNAKLRSLTKGKKLTRVKMLNNTAANRDAILK